MLAYFSALFVALKTNYVSLTNSHSCSLSLSLSFALSFAHRSHTQCQLCALPYRTARHSGGQTVCGDGQNGAAGQQRRRAAAAADADAGAEIPDNDDDWRSHCRAQRVRRVHHAGHTAGSGSQRGQSVCRQ